MRHLIGKGQTTEVDFAGGQVTIRRLSATDVFEIDSLRPDSTEIGDLSAEDTQALGRAVTVQTIRRGVVETGEPLTEDEIFSFPLNDLNDLQAAIMDYSIPGMGGEDEPDEEGND